MMDVECRHGVHGRDYCPKCMGYGYDAGPEPDQDHDPQGMIAEEYRYEESRRAGQDQDTVDDDWGELLRLILDYGTERYSLGAQDTMVMMRGGVPVKRSGHGAPDSDMLGKIIRKLTRLQREAGDD